MRNIIIVASVLVCCFFITALFGQQGTNDSLINVLKTSNSEIQRAHAGVVLASRLMPAHLDSAFNLIESAAILKNYPGGAEKADYLNALGVFHWFKGRHDSAIHTFMPIISMNETPDMLFRLARAYNNIGALFIRKEMYDSAVNYLNEALRIDIERNNEYGIAKTYYDLSVVYSRRGWYEQALRYQLQSIEMTEKVMDTMRLIHGYNVLGNIYTRLSDKDRALESYQKALDLNTGYDKINNLPNIYNNISALLSAYPDDFDKAIEYANKGIIESAKINDYETLCMLHVNIGGAFSSVNKPAEALSQYYLGLKHMKQAGRVKHVEGLYYHLASAHMALGNYDSARYYAHKSLDIAQTTKSIRWQHQALFLLASADSTAGNYKGAFDKYKNAVALRDSIWNIENRNRIAELQIIYDTEKKELENQSLTERNKLNYRVIKNQRYIIILIAALIVLIIAILFRENRSKTKILRQHAAIINQQNEIQEKNIKLEELNKTKDKFFSIIAHDLRGPFSSLNNLLNLLDDEFNEMNDTEKQTIIHALRQNSTNTLNLLENLLDWARSQMGKIENNPQKIDLHKVASQVIDILRSRAEQKQIQLINEIPDFSYAFADKNIAQSILINLINNGIKFSERGGLVQVSSNTSEDEIEINIIDQGIGIPEDKAANLFVLGSNFKRPGTANEPGTGLGLLMVHEFLKIAGGKIIVKSTPEKGSKFTFTLPALKE